MSRQIKKQTRLAKLKQTNLINTQQNNVDKIKTNLNKIIQIIEKDYKDVNLQDTMGNTIFYLACGFGNIELVDYLLKRKDINYNLKNNDNVSGFQIAWRHKHLDIVKLLLLDDRIDVSYE